MYDLLYSAWKREVNDASLGGLASDFYEKMVIYLGRINDNKIFDKKTVKINLLEHEALNVRRMLSELLELRYRKILRTITKMNKIPQELLTNDEIRMSEKFLGFTQVYQEFTDQLLQNQQSEEDTVNKRYIKPEVQVTHKRLTIRLKKNIPAIMGADMKSYGPFSVEDIASLPELNAQILVKQGLAKIIEVSWFPLKNSDSKSRLLLEI